METEIIKKSKSEPVPKTRFNEFNRNWSREKVGSICDFIVPGRNKPTNFIGEIPWITTPDINHHGIISSSKNDLKISKEEAKKIGSKIVPRDSIVISCVGELGLVAITGTNVVINQQLHAFLPSEKINSKFLLYALSVKQRYMNKVATKTAVPYMNKTNCNSIPIIFPELPEQQKIACFLSAMDKKIQQLTQKKGLLEAFKKGVMQQLFSQEIRFKKEDGKEFPEWEEKKLGNICDVRDGTHESPKYFDEGYPLITSKNLMADGSIDFANINFISKVDFDNFNKRSLVERGDIIFGMIGTIGNPVLVKNDGFAIKNVALIKEKKVLKNPFLIHYLKSFLILKQFHRQNTGGTQKFIALGTIRDLEISVPSEKEQQIIADFLSTIDKKIEAVTQQLEKTQSFKKGLLQQMFV